MEDKKYTEEDAKDMTKGAFVFGFMLGVICGVIIAHYIWVGHF